MKNFYLRFRLLWLVGKGALFVLFVLTLATNSYGQNLSVSLSATNNSPDNCTARKLTAAVSGGSGSYAYFWSSNPSSSVSLGNGPSITVSPAVGTTYTVAVQDNVSGQYVQKSILVSPVLTGSFQVFIPNAFFEGNLWRVLDAAKSTGPINAYRYELRIIDDWGNVVYSSSRSVSSGVTGLLGGEITWNGRLYGTGSYVSAGNYFYDLRLVNCSANKLYQGTITFFREANLLVETSPNPANTHVDISYTGSLNSTGQNDLAGALELPASVQLVSSKGDVLLSQNISSLPVRLDVKGLPEDTYSLRIRCGTITVNRRLRIRR